MCLFLSLDIPIHLLSVCHGPVVVDVCFVFDISLMSHTLISSIKTIEKTNKIHVSCFTDGYLMQHDIITGSSNGSFLQ